MKSGGQVRLNQCCNTPLMTFQLVGTRFGVQMCHWDTVLEYLLLSCM